MTEGSVDGRPPLVPKETVFEALRRGVLVLPSHFERGKLLGTLTYDSGLTVYFDDWALAHLQVAIGAKLHNGDSFHFSWNNDEHDNGGRCAIWILPGAPLLYTFTDGPWPSSIRTGSKH